MAENFNWVDYVVLAVFFLSMLTGLARGFIKEVIGLLTWIIAFVVSSLFATKLAAMFTSSQPVQSTLATAGNMDKPVSLAAVGVSFICIFIGVLLIGSLINSIISSVTAGRGIGFANRLFGGLFGLMRGFLLIIIVMFLVGLTPVSAQPFWTQSQFVTAFKPYVIWVDNMVQPSIATLKDKMGRTWQNVSTNFQSSYNNIYQGS